MQSRPEGAADSDLEEVGRILQHARDLQITQVVAIVDALAERGAADALIEPLRPRLAQLRPARPLGFCRLLFTPLDPVIVPPWQWRPDDPAVPRSALMSLAATVSRALGAAAAIDPWRETLAAAGSRLWPEAARVLLSVPPPEGWDETKLPIATYPPLARLVGAILRREPALAALSGPAGLPNAPDDVDSILREVEVDHAPAMPAMVAILLARVPQAGILLARAGDRVTTLLLDHLETANRTEEQGGNAPLRDAGSRLRAYAATLRALEAASIPAQQRVRAQSVRQGLDRASRMQFAQALEHALLLPIRASVVKVERNGASRMETVARDLRELESEARNLGSAEVYDRLLQQAADAVRDCGAGGSLSKVETIRLVEILAGPAAALALL